ncbi:hypothetical protein QJS10_CPA02g01078 [Acorus calamus]|uniref:Uncharacterized protein n=1 Tax=Acorus calamus TaxID=4465 RepID=A0AAV9FEC6_ACOCL|nr:hypothetical protein QJS10_CPA02g01078 [Acorus calamus]
MVVMMMPLLEDFDAHRYRNKHLAVVPSGLLLIGRHGVSQHERGFRDGKACKVLSYKTTMFKECKEDSIFFTDDNYGWHIFCSLDYVDELIVFNREFDYDSEVFCLEDGVTESIFDDRGMMYPYMKSP